MANHSPLGDDSAYLKQFARDFSAGFNRAKHVLGDRPSNAEIQRRVDRAKQMEEEPSTFDLMQVRHPLTWPGPYDWAKQGI